jgi:hypothetical protein
VSAGRVEIRTGLEVSMSFQTEFNDKTDIIYGIGEWISRYIIFKTDGKQYGKQDTVPRAELDAAHKLKAESFFAINTFNLAISGAQYRQANGSLTTTLGTATGTADDAKAAAYAGTIARSPVYGPGSTTGDVAAKFDKLKKSNASLAPTDQQAVNAAAKDLAIRRSSKFGIAYVVERLNGKVHYILDGVDMSVVLDKKTVTNSSGYDKIPIVSSELRYLFRNWSRFKSTGKVLFWKDYKTCPAPWVAASASDLAGWAEYALDRLQKHLAALSSDAAWQDDVKQLKLGNRQTATRLRANIGKLRGGDLRQHANAESFLKTLDDRISSPKNIIEFFHSIPPGLVNKEHTLPT